MEDRQLIENWVKRRSERAFGELVGRYERLVYATGLRKLGDPALAEDLAQRVFIRLARKAARLPDDWPLAGWLHRATVLEAGVMLKSEGARRKRELVWAREREALAGGVEGAADSRRPELDEALLSLRDLEREAVLLRYMQGKTHREIAGVLGTTEEAARKRVERGVEGLAGWFRRWKGGATVAGLAALLSGEAGVAAPAGLAALVSASLPATGGVAAIYMSTSKLAVIGTAAAAAAAIVLWTHPWSGNPEPAPLAASSPGTPSVERELPRVSPVPAVAPAPPGPAAAPGPKPADSATASSTASPPAETLFWGIPVPGKPDMVYSPFKQDAGFVDVSGLPKGAKVRCPYTGKIFLLP